MTFGLRVYMGQVICEARKEEKITQAELGKRIGANKSYISRIENGLIDPSISTIYSIITALGLRIEIVRSIVNTCHYILGLFRPMRLAAVVCHHQGKCPVCRKEKKWWKMNVVILWAV